MLSGNTVTFSTDHLTLFSVVIVSPPDDFSSTVAYPNPYRPSLATHAGAGITFKEMPANADVKICSLSGELVKQLKDDDGDGRINWNAVNEKGESVASGVYLAFLQNGSKSKTVKIAVQR